MSSHSLVIRFAKCFSYCPCLFFLKCIYFNIKPNVLTHAVPSLRKSAYAWHGSCVHTADMFYWCKSFTFHRFCLLTNLAKWLFGIGFLVCCCCCCFFSQHFAKLGCRERGETMLSQFWKNKNKPVKLFCCVGMIVPMKHYMLETSRLWKLKSQSITLTITFFIKTMRNCSGILIIICVLNKGWMRRSIIILNITFI